MSPEGESLPKRAWYALRDDFAQLRLGLHGLGMLSRLLPPQTGNRVRVEMLRALGFTIGEGTRLTGTPRINGSSPDLPKHLVVGRDCLIDLDVTFDLGDRITLGDGVTLGHSVMILTTTHELGPREHRAGPLTFAPVNIGNGAWLGARVVVLPGVTVGEGAIVAEGSLVNKDVPPHTRVAGIPARGNEKLEP